MTDNDRPARLPRPGADLRTLDDDTVRALIAEYHLSSPWYGESAEYTLRDEVHHRDPRSRHLHHAVSIASQADSRPYPGPPNMLWKDSPATAALRDAYDQAVQAWLDGPAPVLSQRLAAAAPHDPDHTYGHARAELRAAGTTLDSARRHLATATAHAARVAADAIAHHGVHPDLAREDLDITAETLRHWLTTTP